MLHRNTPPTHCIHRWRIALKGSEEFVVEDEQLDWDVPQAALPNGRQTAIPVSRRQPYGAEQRTNGRPEVYNETRDQHRADSYPHAQSQPRHFSQESSRGSHFHRNERRDERWDEHHYERRDERHDKRHEEHRDERRHECRDEHRDENHDEHQNERRFATVPRPPQDKHRPPLISAAERTFTEQLLFSAGFDWQVLLPADMKENRITDNDDARDTPRDVVVQRFMDRMEAITAAATSTASTNVTPTDMEAAQLDVLSPHFRPDRALEAALAANGAVRMPAMARPWSGVKHWYTKVVGEAL